MIQIKALSGFQLECKQGKFSCSSRADSGLAVWWPWTYKIYLWYLLDHVLEVCGWESLLLTMNYESRVGNLHRNISISLSSVQGFVFKLKWKQRRLRRSLVERQKKKKTGPRRRRRWLQVEVSQRASWVLVSKQALVLQMIPIMFSTSQSSKFERLNMSLCFMLRLGVIPGIIFWSNVLSACQSICIVRV